MNKFFYRPRLKVRRANSHIDNIISASSALPKDLYKVAVSEGITHALLVKPDQFYLRYSPNVSVSEYFSAIIGDTVNNLRESLEYWINAAMAIKNVDGCHFPASRKREGLEITSAYKSVNKNFPELANFIKTNVDPCGDTNKSLYAVVELNNENKHKGFIPAITVAEIRNINAKFGFNNVMQNCIVRGDADGQLNILRSFTPISIEDNFETTVEVVFAKGAIFEDQPVVPTLLHLSQITSQTLDALDKFITPYVA